MAGLNERLLLISAFVLRLVFYVYGIYQDANFQVKYTDIDYFVFHDAAMYVYHGASPYLRDTYRYTPLLSWLLSFNFHLNWFDFGKLLFVLFDLFSGIIIMKLIKQNSKISNSKLLILSSIWLLNPMVITISTRGNAESVLSFLILLSIYYLQKGKYILSGLVYGLSIHFKIYPIIYSLPIALYIYRTPKWFSKLLKMGLSTLITTIMLGYMMYSIYGQEFLEHSYIYHFYRSDHRHNFSLWNILLYFDSAINNTNSTTFTSLSKFAFLPQLLMTFTVSILVYYNPTFLTLLKVLFVETFAFVTYNKVCTSQYFIWYLIFLPFLLVNTTISKQKGIVMILVWVITQAAWLSQGYLLEFKGENVFFPGIFITAVAFFLGNIWLLGQCIQDIKGSAKIQSKKTLSKKLK
ncbi:hypothetical protein Kpol_1010p38 [Vanderwaltozyma polyspora DSM 70294]|uniref:GPI mannosyltransferase 1 n=1 Tax=Vanderwaltozyma polyspora (strain ATCC 22028 / DSM 70294 / BCRC 21397 / CBS 2163 / NBRC 10782 / NRRL Y-8283 / UCD 57-17) TaxID=436907 RepID=A7TII4_VANPO|nr:uncharacterized protein Kpol_1010p38 [Vanderwaltozyma polyspora DSM 70294]EDO17922.1 hypothetical protein Kpol_1010p38 [Vanderwaltozyma polyspora DSM 70294]